jgi:hypothetical protein
LTVAGIEEDGEAHTLGILRELRELAKEISDGHMDYAHRFHELLQTACNTNLPDVAKDFGFKVFSTTEQVGARGRTIAVCANITIAIAAWECACMIFPKDRWYLTWGGMVQYDSAREWQTKPKGIQTWIENP